MTLEEFVSSGQIIAFIDEPNFNKLLGRKNVRTIGTTTYQTIEFFGLDRGILGTGALEKLLDRCEWYNLYITAIPRPLGAWIVAKFGFDRDGKNYFRKSKHGTAGWVGLGEGTSSHGGEGHGSECIDESNKGSDG